MRAFALAAAFAAISSAQPGTFTQGSHRVSIELQRLEGEEWRAVDPALVLAQGDRVRFRFSANFDGYLYVMNLSTSGKYEQLFPRQETGQNNRIAADKEYLVPATSAAFRIAGPPGFETVYWLVTPARLTDAPPHPAAPPPDLTVKVPTLIPRCDDAVLRARGDCVDHAAGLKLAPRGEQLPRNLAGAVSQDPRDLTFLRQRSSTVAVSNEPLVGPMIYEFRVAHR
jgi:hypothetical protein